MDIRPFHFGPRFDTASVDLSRDALLEQIAALEARLAERQAAHEDTLAATREAAYQRGRDDARAETATALQAAVEVLHAQLDTIGQRLDERVSALAQDAADLALAGADLLSGHVAIRWPTAAVEAALGRVLRDTERATELAIRVHPSLAPALDVWLAERPAALTRRRSIEIVPDEDLAPGDGVVDWGSGGLAVDATARRAALLAELAAAMEQTPAAPQANAITTNDRVKEDGCDDPAVG